MPPVLVVLIIYVTLPSYVESSWFGTSPRVDMNFTELVKFDGYQSEWHHVTTEDGYVLSIFRVSSSKCNKRYKETSVHNEKDTENPVDIRNLSRTSDERNRLHNETYSVKDLLVSTRSLIVSEVNDRTFNKSRNVFDIMSTERVPILFTHAMYMSGDVCALPGPRKAHCYLYADACHDVWVFNARGTRYSRTHKTLDPDTNPEYWNFSFEEMSVHDLPVTIDFILGRTKMKQIAVIGHSQGAAIHMLLCAKKPEYNDKIKIGFGLSPITMLSNSRFVLVKIEELLSNFSPWMDKTGRHFEVFGRLSQRLLTTVCGKTKLSYPYCSALIFAFIGYNGFDISPEVLPVFFAHWSGTSAKNFLRWGQTIKNGFSEYDYGEEENLKKYGVKKPPLYDLSKVTMKWVLITSTNDYIAEIKDVDTTVSQLLNVKKCVLSDNRVGHLDFVVGNSAVKYVVPIILSVLEENKYICL